MENSSKIMIEACGLSKFYGAFVAIRDVSFSIPQGQIVAFLGPNGAGKSTTMKILSGFLSASEGKAKLAGFDIKSDRMEIAKRLGYLPENGPLYENMTPRELLLFFGEVRGINGNQLSQGLERVISICSLEQVLEKPISKLSRGYRQRVGLAQALLHDPDVLIMDEPTAGLDPNQIRDFRENIRQLGKTKTILISTHILQEAEAVADRILLIHNGSLKFDGATKDLKQNSSFEESFYKLTDFGKNNEEIEAGEKNEH